MYNRVVHYIESTRLEPINEDLLCSVKEHLRITFNSDDSYLKGLIDAALTTIELYLNKALTLSEITVVLSGHGVGFLPFYTGTISDFSIKRMDGEMVEPAFNNFGLLELPIHDDMCTIQNAFEVKYTTGYTEIPIHIMSGICSVVAYLYNNRGDEAGMNKNILQLVPSFLNSFKRATWAGY